MSSFAELWQRLPMAEAQLRGILPWDPGESRLWLWVSTLLTVVIGLNIFAHGFGWICEKAARRLFPTSRKDL